MNCSNCGTYMADGWRFCKGCGSESGPHRPAHQAETIPLRGGYSPSTDPTLVLQNPPRNTPPPPTAETVQSPWPQPGVVPNTNQNAWSPLPAAPSVQPRRPGNVLIPILIVVGILALGAGTVVALVLTGVIGNQNSGIAASGQPNGAPDRKVGGGDNANAAETPTPDAPNANTVTPTPTPPSPPDDTPTIRARIASRLDAWADSLRRRNLDENIGFYAERLDVYYGSSNVSRDKIRANRAQIFNRYYDSTDVQLSNMDIVLSADGNSATVTYDNTYNWRGGTKTLSGKSRNKMTMELSGEWIITSEIHLSQYYENRGG